MFLVEKMGFKKGLRIYSTVTDLKDVTQRYSIPYLTFVYHCKTNRFIYHKKELIESGEYKDFDIKYVRRG